MLLEQCAEHVHGPWPERAEPLLPPLAAEARLERPHELQVRRAQVEQFLDACAGIEEREQQRMIAAAVGCRAVGRVEDGGDLSSLEIFDDARRCALEGNGEDPLAQLEVLGVIRRDEAREGVDGCEPSVSCCNAVLTCPLEVVKEGEDLIRRDVVEVELHDRATPGEEAKEQRARVAVAANRVRAHAADPRQVIGEELAQGAGQRSGQALHGALRAERAIILRQWRSKRTLAASATGSSNWR